MADDLDAGGGLGQGAAVAARGRGPQEPKQPKQPKKPKEYTSTGPKLLWELSGVAASALQGEDVLGELLSALRIAASAAGTTCMNETSVAGVARWCYWRQCCIRLVCMAIRAKIKSMLAISDDTNAHQKLTGPEIIDRFLGRNLTTGAKRAEKELHSFSTLPMPRAAVEVVIEFARACIAHAAAIWGSDPALLTDNMATLNDFLDTIDPDGTVTFDWVTGQAATNGDMGAPGTAAGGGGAADLQDLSAGPDAAAAAAAPVEAVVAVPAAPPGSNPAPAPSGAAAAAAAAAARPLAGVPGASSSSSGRQLQGAAPPTASLVAPAGGNRNLWAGAAGGRAAAIRLVEASAVPAPAPAAAAAAAAAAGPSSTLGGSLRGAERSQRSTTPDGQVVVSQSSNTPHGEVVVDAAAGNGLPPAAKGGSAAAVAPAAAAGPSRRGKQKDPAAPQQQEEQREEVQEGEQQQEEQKVVVVDAAAGTGLPPAAKGGSAAAVAPAAAAAAAAAAAGPSRRGKQKDPAAPQQQEHQKEEVQEGQQQQEEQKVVVADAAAGNGLPPAAKGGSAAAVAPAAAAAGPPRRAKQKAPAAPQQQEEQREEVQEGQQLPPLGKPPIRRQPQRGVKEKLLAAAAQGPLAANPVGKGAVAAALQAAEAADASIPQQVSGICSDTGPDFHNPAFLGYASLLTHEPKVVFLNHLMLLEERMSGVSQTVKGEQWELDVGKMLDLLWAADQAFGLLPGKHDSIQELREQVREQNGLAGLLKEAQEQLAKEVKRRRPTKAAAGSSRQQRQRGHRQLGAA